MAEPEEQESQFIDAHYEHMENELSSPALGAQSLIHGVEKPHVLVEESQQCSIVGETQYTGMELDSQALPDSTPCCGEPPKATAVAVEQVQSAGTGISVGSDHSTPVLFARMDFEDNASPLDFKFSAPPKLDPNRYSRPQAKPAHMSEKSEAAQMPTESMSSLNQGMCWVWSGGTLKLKIKQNRQPCKTMECRVSLKWR